MTFLQHIKLCNEHDLSRFRPLILSGRRIGWIKNNLFQCFAGFPEYILCTDRDIQIKPHLNTARLLGEAKVGDVVLSQRVTDTKTPGTTLAISK